MNAANIGILNVGQQHGAGRIVRRIASRAGISKPVGPHTLRHAFITAALDAGVPLRDGAMDDNYKTPLITQAAKMAARNVKLPGN